ncbi:unnamed protein product [Closterium sp. NIES-53]
MSVSGSARRFGLEDSVMRVAECGAGAGAMIMRAVMGSIGGNVGPIAHPAHSAGREPKLGAGAAGDECLPWMLTGGVERVHHEKRSVSQGAEGEASNRAKKVKSAGGITNAGPKEAAPVVAALKDVFVAFGRLAIAVEGTNEGAQDDEEAEARDAQRKYLAARAAVKGAGRGAEGGTSKSAEIIQTPMTMWHDRMQKSELVLTDQEEEEWTLDLDLARKMTAGLYAVKPTVESAICAAIGLEAADNETAVKGKAQKALYADALAFGCAAM